MRITALLSLMSIIFSYANAQDVNSIELNKGLKRLVITPETWYYADTAYHTTEEIINNPGKFVFKNAKVPLAYSLGYTKKYYWFRFILNNKNPEINSYKLVIGKISLHHLEVFSCKKNQPVSLGITGINFPFHQRPYPSCYFVYPINIDTSETVTYYTFIDNRNYDLQAGFILFTNEYYKQFEEKTYFGFGIICGVFVFVFAFNLLLYLFTLDSLHIWYSFYTVISVWQILSYEGIDYQYLFPNNPLIMSFSRSLTTQLFFLIVLIVMPKYINQQKSNSQYYDLTNILKWIMLAFTSSFIFFSVYYNSYSVNYFFGISVKILYLIATFILIISCIEQFKKGTKVALFYLIGLIVYLFGMLDYILFILKLTDNIYKFPSLFQVFSVLEVIIISYGILYRYNTYRKEKNKLAQLLTQTKLNVSQQLLQTQENERKRIAEDLHDELGGNLAAIKMTLQSFEMPDEQSQLVTHLIDKASDNARNISHNLMPPEFQQTGLDKILDNFYRRLNKEEDIKFHFYYSGSDHYFDEQDKLMIYRIIMELTTNIVKHSQATEATIQLIYHEKYLEIMAEDNGKGFSAEASDGIGLKNIRSRVIYLNGTINIDSSPHGTTTMIQVPYKHNK